MSETNDMFVWNDTWLPFYDIFFIKQIDFKLMQI